MSVKHQDYLLTALQLAQQRRGFCAPNPAVGAIIVQNERIVGEGYHWGCGHPHAEVEALRAAGDKARGATAYVTLEPCRHYGRTPPCTSALIEAGITQVFYGVNDPNPLMAGQSQALLREVGIACEKVNVPALEAFYQSYAYWWQHKKPWVTAKLAISLDAKIAGAGGVPVTLTGHALKIKTFEARLRADALLTTVRTLIQDDPLMNVRLEGQSIAKPLYVMDTHLQLPLTAQVLKTCKPVTVLHGPGVDRAQAQALAAQGVRCCEVAVDATTGQLNLEAVFALIGADGCHDVWVEAGGRLFSALVSARLVHCGIIYVAPTWLGCKGLDAFVGDQLPTAREVKWEIVGQDAVCEMLF